MFIHENELMVGPESRTVVIGDLLKYTQYRIELLGYNLMGDGVPNSPPLISRTGEDLPGPVSEIEFHSVSSRELRLQWKPPYQPNGIITHYEVAYRRNTSEPGTEKRQELAGDLRVYAVANLFIDTLYRFEITAQTRLGWGPTRVVYGYTTDQRGI